MVNLEYKILPAETSRATIDFLTNRPFIIFIFFVMKISCICYFFGFTICLYYKSLKLQNFVVAFIALLWLLLYKKINFWILNKHLNRNRSHQINTNIRFDNKSIFSILQDAKPLHIEWKKLKYILQNKDGYIIPLTGAANAGKFMWLPYRCFTEKNQKQSFLDIISKFNLKIKKLRH